MHYDNYHSETYFHISHTTTVLN